MSDAESASLRGGASGSNAERFVILAAPRTGSNLLCTLLNSHPDILCHHELFNPGGILLAIDQRDGPFGLGTVAERDADPVSFLDRVWKLDLGRRIVGFKMTHGQEGAAMDAVVADAAVKKIVLRRRNRVKTYVSELVSLELDQWEVYTESELLARPRVTVDPKLLDENIARNERFYSDLVATLDGRGQEHAEVEYEDLGRSDTHQRLLASLGLRTTVRLHAGTVKQNPRDLRQIVANYPALSAALRGNELQAELHASDD